MHLTENGRARFTQIGLKLKTAQDEALSVFAPDEREAFERYLLRLIEGLRR